jgi:xylulose-5-phosphate/fructose-6-phosphate phosphoketolase
MATAMENRTYKPRTRIPRKPVLTPGELKQIDAYWRASNYLSAGQLYLLDNPLLKRPLCPGKTLYTPI